MRRAPDPLQPLTDFGPAQIAEMDAKAAAIGEGCIARSGAGEVRVDVDDATDVADQDEGWPPVILGEGAGILHRLRLGRPHQILSIASGGAAGRVPLPHPALLGLEHEGVASVEIDPGRRAAAALAAADHRALEHIIVALVRCIRWIGFGQAECSAQADQEQLVVRPFLPALAPLPTGDEGFEGIVRKRLYTRKEHALRLATIRGNVHKNAVMRVQTSKIDIATDHARVAEISTCET
jgi:hypothetical protein